MSIGPWDFNGFDMIVLAIILVSLLTAASRGLFRELITLIAIIIAGIVSLFIFGRYRAPVQDFIQPAILADITLWGGTAIIVYVIVMFSLSGLSRSRKGSALRLTNRMCGAGFGAIRGLIISALAVMALSAQYRSSVDAQEFKTYIAENETQLPPGFVDKLPASVKKQLEDPPAELPVMLQGSTFYPLLEKIGNGIRRLPFAKARSLVDKVGAGESINPF